MIKSENYHLKAQRPPRGEMMAVKKPVAMKQAANETQKKAAKMRAVKKPAAIKPATRFVVVSNCFRNCAFLRFNMIKHANYYHLKTKTPKKKPAAKKH